MTTAELTRDDLFEIYRQIGNVWEKGHYRRVYINDLEQRAADAFENLPKRQQRSLRRALNDAKVYFDYADGRLHVKSGDLSLLKSTFGVPTRTFSALDLIWASIHAERDELIAAREAADGEITGPSGHPTAIDPTTPAGSTPEATAIGLIERGWTEAEIAAGVRFRGRETFICPGCGQELPRELGMSASTAFVCPNCYDQFS